MSWSGDFKRLRMAELNHMKLKDRMNYTMVSEYQAICNGVANPLATHNFNTEEAKNWHRRTYGKYHHFEQTKMNPNLKTKPMVSRSGVVKDHAAFNQYPSCPQECDDILNQIRERERRLSSPSLSSTDTFSDDTDDLKTNVSMSIQIEPKVPQSIGFAERFRKSLSKSFNIAE